MAVTSPPATKTVTLTIDGNELTVAAGTTIWTAARDAGIEIPVLCHDERYDPVGVCRLCVVDVGGRVYAAACVRPCEDGMEVDTTNAEIEARRGTLTQLLNAIQREHGWLPREELVRLSREQRRPLYEIEGLISFYPHFHTDPPPAVDLACCHDLSCWLQGAEERIGELRERYEGDPDVHLREVSCVGRCDTAPAVTVNERPARASEAEALVDEARGATRNGNAVGAQRASEPHPNDPYAQTDRDYRVLRAALDGSLSAQAIVDELKESSLRGMGGAGFPTGRKWELVAAQENEPKYAICNADESEPGTFKDRQIMAEQPHLVIEGLLLGMVAAGCPQGWIFIRHEYGPEEAVLREEIERLNSLGVLDETGLELDIFVSPGGYILGEESALIECMEGHRGEPRNKPPFPGVHGLWGKPTLMNSVETFAHVPVILDRGAEWWKAQGIGESDGLKFFAVSGDVEEPGVYCVPMGTKGRELLELAGGVAGGAEVAAIQPGGASSNFLGPDGLDVELDFASVADAGSMLGSGALVVMAEGTNLLAAATNVLRFFRNESCGKCVPCRVGSTKAHTLLTELLSSGGGVEEVDDRIAELEKTMRMTSICGLGQVALGPVVSVLGLNGGGAEARPHPRSENAPEDEPGAAPPSQRPPEPG